MSNLKDGGPAFPVISERCGEYCGMSLRDYFAAAALQGMLSRDNAPHPEDKQEAISRWCYQIADAMLSAREAE